MLTPVFVGFEVMKLTGIYEMGKFVYINYLFTLIIDINLKLHVWA